MYTNIIFWHFLKIILCTQSNKILHTTYLIPKCNKTDNTHMTGTFIHAKIRKIYFRTLCIDREREMFNVYYLEFLAYDCNYWNQIQIQYNIQRTSVPLEYPVWEVWYFAITNIHSLHTMLYVTPATSQGPSPPVVQMKQTDLEHVLGLNGLDIWSFLLSDIPAFSTARILRPSSLTIWS